MQKKYLLFSFIVLFCFTLMRCKEDDVAPPPKPTLTVDRTSGLVDDTEFTFTISQVSADAISVLPYGLAGNNVTGNDAGIRIKSFTNGQATVKFKYAKPGTFRAIARSNNNSGDGANANTESDPIEITITSDDNSITDFKFDKISTKTVIDQTAGTILVTVPFGTDITKLKATYTASGFTTVTIAGVTQTNGSTENSFASAKVYRVTAHDGSTRDYTVSVTVTPVETITTIKSMTGKAVSKSAKNKTLPGSVNNTDRTVVFYDVLGTPSTQFDSVRVGYVLDGKFAILKYGGKKIKQDSLLNLTSSKQVAVFSQDSTAVGGTQTYSLYAAAAPKLNVSFPSLNPNPALTTQPVDFSLNINALAGTNLNAIATEAIVTLPAGVTLNEVRVNNAAFTDGSNVNYSEPVKFELVVVDSNLGGGVTYTVNYTVTVKIIP
jgi:hypothetical protein